MPSYCWNRSPSTLTAQLREKQCVCVCMCNFIFIFVCQANTIFKCLRCTHTLPPTSMNTHTRAHTVTTPQPVFKLCGKKPVTKLKEKDMCLGCRWLAVLWGTLICKQLKSLFVSPSLAYHHSLNYVQTSSLNGHCTVWGTIYSYKLYTMVPEAY